MAASELLPNSRLLTYTGWGHTAFLGGNACVDETVTAYLLSPTAAAGDTVCQAVGSPFDPVTAQRVVAAPLVVAATLPESVRRALE